MSKERVAPQTLEAEASVLGAMLLDFDAIPKVLEYLDESCFYSVAHKKVFKAITQLFEKNVPADVITVTEELKRAKDFETVGGTNFLAGLVENVLSTANVEEHARLVLEKATQRKLIQTASQIIEESYTSESPADELLDRAEQLIFKIKEEKLRPGFAYLKDLLKPTVKEIEELHQRERTKLITGIETGFYILDERTSGLQPGEFIIIAGRPSMGKTSLALNIAVNAALKDNIPVAFFSLEMSKELLVQRLISSEAKISLRNLRRGKLESKDWARLTTALGPLYQIELYIDDSPAMPVLELRAKARRLKAEIPLGLLIIDYIQLLRPPKTVRTQISKQEEISEISRSLKALAKELHLPVVALSQLSRLPERRDPKKPKPQLADLRDSGSLEQDADLVLLLYRDEFYHPDKTEKEGTAEVNIAKQRNGPIGRFELAFLKEYMRFESLTLREVEE